MKMPSSITQLLAAAALIVGTDGASTFLVFNPRSLPKAQCCHHEQGKHHEMSMNTQISTDYCSLPFCQSMDGFSKMASKNLVPSLVINKM
jgi:hypothetical protein